MQVFISSVSSIGVIAVLCAMFVIVLVCIQKAVKEMSFFGDRAGLAVSFCVALLSIIGLVRFFGSLGTAATPTRAPGETGGLLDVILLPYVALALAILLVLLLLGASKVLAGRQARHPRADLTHRRAVIGSHTCESESHERETKSYD